ncbi:transposase [Pseudomonas sp. Pseusp122]|uniref:REP-associated tyrosine transposase n=1 Tax=unclassified Pseudomonas TaxID=196821 RepID=UPI0039A5C84F
MPTPFNGHRLRRGRFSAEGHVYLLTAVTARRNPLFADWQLGRLVVQQLRSAHEQEIAHSMCWLVMPDHFHWLIELKQCSLSEVMCRVKSRSSRAIKQRTGNLEPIWQKGFHDRALRKDDDLLTAARYIIANPLRAGLVRRVADYPLWDAQWL